MGREVGVFLHRFTSRPAYVLDLQEPFLFSSSLTAWNCYTARNADPYDLAVLHTCASIYVSYWNLHKPKRVFLACGNRCRPFDDTD